jgi:hypothetical protein
MFDGATRAGVGPVAAQHQPIFLIGVVVGEPFSSGATRAGVGPVAAQHQPIFLIGVVVGEPFSSGTNVDVLFGHVAEVLLAKTPFRLRV